jgi:hypothetical protein
MRIPMTFRRLANRCLRRTGAEPMQGSSTLKRIHAELTAAGRSGRPILVGPWLSEVGFELLYWIPFLNWAAEQYGLDRRNVIAVSRGGAPWYRNIATTYVDVFEDLTIEDYKSQIEARSRLLGHQKQYDVLDFDNRVLERARQRLPAQAQDAHVVHPSGMNQLFRPYWYERAPVGMLTKHTDFQPLPDPGPPAPAMELPQQYVAVRFYFRPSFPDTAENRRFATDVIRRLARERPIVLLNPGFQVDDHADLDVSTGMGIHRIHQWMTPANNLTIQAQIVSRAKALVGTYGGLSYLWPCYRLPTLSFYSAPEELVSAHLDTGWRLSRVMSTPLVSLHSGDVDLINSAIGRVDAGRDLPSARAHTSS